MKEILLMILALLPQPSKTPEELPRLETIARAIELETKDAELRRYAVAVFFHESTFDRRVHSGQIKGDCRWTGGKIGKGTRIPGTCRSSCLGQILLMKGQRTPKPDRFRAKDLVGVDLAATRRCARVSVLVLERARKACGGKYARPSCIFAHYGGIRFVGENRFIRARVGTFWRLAGILQRAAKP